jgi:serine/threonine protein kinase
MDILLGILVLFLVVPAVLVALMFAILPIIRALGYIVGLIARFIRNVIADTLRALGTLITALVFVFLVLGNVLVGRWSAARHFAAAVGAELTAFSACLYRLLIGHPARLLMLDPLVEGIERRVPAAMLGAPGPTMPAHAPSAGPLNTLSQPTPDSDTPAQRHSRPGVFDGYTITGTLPGGGSGSRLYIARPEPRKLAELAGAGFAGVDQVVIKSFSVREGSSLPQIVRENRALIAARRMGLVLEHDLSSDRFYYVMKFVPGPSLGLAVQSLHAAAPAQGLDTPAIRTITNYALDLLTTLDQYHRAGLWHKDIKPDNIIVSSADHRAHLVDFGLLTPLRSTMTLTTHGTEYFRDPEMVRMALRGVKVADVDGAKFDIYGSGAVMFAMIENNFPAHGALSQITRRCPEALRWIVRRAMTDYDKRYTSASDVLADLRMLAQAPDPFAVRPSQLPSFRAALSGDDADAVGPVGPAVVAPPASPAPSQAAADALPVAPTAPATPATPAAPAIVAGSPVPPNAVPRPPVRPAPRPAHEQLLSARARMEQRRQRARDRIARNPGVVGIHGPRRPITINAGVIAAAGIFVLILMIALFGPHNASDNAAANTPPRTPTSTPPSFTHPIALTIDGTRIPAPRTVASRFGTGRIPPATLTPVKTPTRVLLLREPALTLGLPARLADDRIAVLRSTGLTVIDPAQSPVRSDTSIAPPASSPATEPAASLTPADANAIEASFRAALGLAPPNSADALFRMHAWLNAHRLDSAAPIDAVIILSLASTDPLMLDAWVVAATARPDTSSAIRSAMLMPIPEALFIAPPQAPEPPADPAAAADLDPASEQP